MPKDEHLLFLVPSIRYRVWRIGIVLPSYKRQREGRRAGGPKVRRVRDGTGEVIGLREGER